MRWLPVALVPLVLAGCFQPAGPHLEVDPEQAILTDTVEWTVRLSVEELFTYMHPGCGERLFDLTVATQNGTVALYAYGTEPDVGPCVVTEKTLAKGTHEETFEWNGRTEADQPDAHNGVRVPDGTYTLTGRLRGTNMTADAVVAVSLGG